MQQYLLQKSSWSLIATLTSIQDFYLYVWPCTLPVELHFLQSYALSTPMYFNRGFAVDTTLFSPYLAIDIQALAGYF
jgi:hypothetical protein